MGGRADTVCVLRSFIKASQGRCCVYPEKFPTMLECDDSAHTVVAFTADTTVVVFIADTTVVVFITATMTYSSTVRCCSSVGRAARVASACGARPV